MPVIDVCSHFHLITLKGASSHQSNLMIYIKIIRGFFSAGRTQGAAIGQYLRCAPKLPQSTMLSIEI